MQSLSQTRAPLANRMWVCTLGGGATLIYAGRYAPVTALSRCLNRPLQLASFCARTVSLHVGIASLQRSRHALQELRDRRWPTVEASALLWVELAHPAVSTGTLVDQQTTTIARRRKRHEGSVPPVIAQRSARQDGTADLPVGHDLV